MRLTGLWKYEAQPFRICFVCFALINDSAFLERKPAPRRNTVGTDLSKASPLAVALKGTRFVNLPRSQRSGGQRQQVFPPVDREATREKMRPSSSARPVEEGQGMAGGLWRGARMTMTGLVNETSKSFKQYRDTQHETINSYFPSSSQSNLINLDLTHSDFAIIPCHHGTIPLSQHSKALLNLVQLFSQLHLLLPLMNPPVMPNMSIL